MRIKKKLIIVAFALVFVLSFVASNVFASQTDTLTIDSLGSGGWSFSLQGNEKVSGEVLISHSIKFWITNPDGFIIENYGVINQTTPYEFTATKVGDYALKFQSLYFGEIQVQASYNVERSSATIPDGVDTTAVAPVFVDALVISVIVAIVVIAVVGSFVFLGVRWLKK